MPGRARKTEAALIGKAVDARKRSRQFCRFCESEFTPISDVRGSAAYRRA